MANNKIATSELEFDAIKQNLKTFLSGQAEFTDYNFEGSGLSVLLDVLAYNTHYNALYTNLAVNESFLDSASKRNSVVSLAKMIGYTPRSATAARVTLNLQVTAQTSSPPFITLPKGSPFVTSVDGKSYTFYTNQDYTAVKTADAATNYLFTNVVAFEGIPLVYNYVASTGTRYIIPNIDSDISTLTVKVQSNSSSSVYTTFNSYSSISDIDSSINAYFVKEIDDGLYELIFGDGVIGSALSDGNIIHIEYFVTSKSAVNGASNFTYTGSTLIGGIASVTVVSSAAGGADIESVESIKYNAPKFYSARNRAVTPDDYQTLILQNFPEAEFVSVWGGEDNFPPVYGKVFVCVKPKNVDKLSELQKTYIRDSILNSRNMVSIQPNFVDPEYINIGLDISVYYNSSSTTKTVDDIKAAVAQTITDYDTENLEKFNGILRYSKLVAEIDSTDKSINNNITAVTLRRSLVPKYGISAQYYINLINPIVQDGFPGAVKSTTFNITGDSRNFYLLDDGAGQIQMLYDTSESTGIVYLATTGTVVYSTGIIDVSALNISSAINDQLTFTIRPKSNDVVSALTQIARIDLDNTTITVISDTSASGDIRGGFNYTFAQS